MKKISMTARKRNELILNQLKLTLDSINNKATEYTESYIDELNLHSGYPPFVDRGIVTSVIIEVFFDWYDDERIKTLSNNDKLEEFKDLSRRIDERIEDMPLKYRISVPLPSGEMKNIKFNKNISLSTIEEAIFPAQLNGSKNIHHVHNKTQTVNDKVLRNYLMVEDRGYIAGFEKERLLNYDAFYLYKIFASISIVNKSWDQARLFLSLTLREPTVVYTYKIEETDNPRNRRIKTHTVEDNTLMKRYKFTDENKQDTTNELFKMLIERQKSSVIRDMSERLQKSLFWFYEFKKIQYDHLKIVYAVSSIDAFFQINDGANMKRAVIATELAVTYDRENEIVNTITKLYDRRNSIIHGSEAIVSTGSSQSLESLDDSSLVHEISLVLESLIKNRLVKLMKTKKAF